LFAVVEHLKRVGQVGTYPNALQYIAGTADMTWGAMQPPTEDHLQALCEVDEPTKQEMRHGGFTFFAATTNTTTMALVGSLNHLIGGGSCPSLSIRSSSNFDAARRALAFLIENGRDEKAFTSAVERPSEISSTDVEEGMRHLTGTKQRLEFLARTYDLGETKRGTSVLIGSPLYVALAD
jgi:hypothetical protein